MLGEFLNFFMKPVARQIEEEEEEPPIKQLSPKVLGAIFAKLENEDVQKFKNSAKFLLNAHKSERRMIAGPTCDANVYYNNNKELRLEMTIMVEVPWTRILPFKRTIPLTRTIPFDQWNYFFKNAKCKKFSMTVEEEEMPLEILKEILCCKSIEISTYSGKSINQMTIDLLAAYKPRSFKIVVDDWSSQIMHCRESTGVMIECLKNIDDIVEVLKSTYNSIISLKPETYEKNEHSIIKLKHNTEHWPLFLFNFAKNTNEQKIRSIEIFLENSLSDVYGFYVECRFIHGNDYDHFLCISC